MRTANPTQAAAINALLTREQISSNSDAFGNNETNSGGINAALPIYQPVAINVAPVTVCTSNGDAHRNKLGYRRFLTLSLAANSLVTITVTAQGANADPDFVVHTGGDAFVFDEGTSQSETINQRPFAAGTHIIEVYDYNATAGGASCMTVSVQGT